VESVKIRYDARGLAEPDAQAPRNAIIEIAAAGDGAAPGARRAVFDADQLSARQINLELRRLVYDEGIADVTILNPGAKHSVAVGLLARCKITIDGSLGYFGCGLIDGPEIRIKGRVGWSVAENMMSGVVIIDKNAGSLAGAALRGGDLVIRGDVGARTGIDQKGGTIIAGGNAGMMTGFMLQRGRMIICGDVGGGLGDSMYDGVIYVGGKVKSLGVDCVEDELSAADHELLARKLRIYGVESPGSFRKFVCGRKLWNYDNLEPAERKLVL
jgi:glutamate synthase domain-containing protein 3